MSFTITGKRIIITVVFVAVFAVTAVICLFAFRVSHVAINGNTYYSFDEIKSFVLPGPDDKYAILKENSLYLWFKYRNKKITDMPFIEEISVTIDSRNSIQIKVYEKSLVAYIKYMGSYLLFDRDGTVIESLHKPPDGLPEIIGLSFQQINLHEPLPVEDKRVFGDILEISLNLTSVGLTVGAINVAYEGYALQMGDVTVYLDGTDNLKAKLGRVKSVFDTGTLAGKSGYATLRIGSNNVWEMVFTQRN